MVKKLDAGNMKIKVDDEVEIKILVENKSGNSTVNKVNPSDVSGNDPSGTKPLVIR